MSWALTAMAGSAVLGFLSSENQASATESAAATSGAASAAAIAEQKRQFDLAWGRSEPFYNAGVNALARQVSGQEQGGAFAQRAPFSFSPENYAANKDPGFDYQLSQTLKALERTAAARGGLLGGRPGMEAMRHAQGMVSGDYQKAFDRALTGYNSAGQERDTQWNMLAGQSGTAALQSQQLNSQGAAMANNIGNIGMTNAANQAGATLTGAAARNSAYGGMSNNLGAAAFSPYSPFRSTGGSTYDMPDYSYGGGMDPSYGFDG